MSNIEFKRIGITEYLDAALRKQNLPSDRQLCLRIGEPPATICGWRLGKSLPRKDATMIRLAELAGKDVEQALIDLGEWRAERANDAATASVYATMRKHLQQARQATAGAAMMMCVAVGFSAIPDSPVHASTNAVQPDMQGSSHINYTHKIYSK
ncbi:hypothetical protein [Kordiimonas aquimaris]|uniref:hypothetical protein n=1 Tax=Kordiimonas aquimaris TaxID=707591 RepID=UPI0021CFDCCF|nr:hypothetical protein [Kordiimonas aquimaris]